MVRDSYAFTEQSERLMMASEPRTGKGEIVLYQTSDGQAALEVRLEGETLWLSLNQIADLFERDKSVISRHLSNIFRTGELARKAVVAFFATTASDGNKRIGAFLFLWFLDRHGILYATNGGKRLADSTLVALTLLIAESRPQEKDLMITLIVNLINQKN